MAKRIQRKRTKGWRMPPNTVYVGRGSKWGNPFRVIKKRTGGYSVKGNAERGVVYGWKIYAIERSIELYKERAAKHIHPLELQKLKGKDLACWCPLDQPCHADILLELANNTKGR